MNGRDRIFDGIRAQMRALDAWLAKTCPICVDCLRAREPEATPGIIVVDEIRCCGCGERKRGTTRYEPREPLPHHIPHGEKS